jgi:hypothetical protein
MAEFKIKITPHNTGRIAIKDCGEIKKNKPNSALKTPKIRVEVLANCFLAKYKYN